MRVGLIHFTPQMHKLTEMLARECYQSYNKMAPDSHNFIKGIMAKGHISIASAGNMVFGLAGISGVDEYAAITTDLMIMKEINNFIRWSQPDAKKNPDSKIGIILSMNILTFLDIYNNLDKHDVNTNLFNNIVSLVASVPELKWFFDKDATVEPSDNPYTALPEPELYSPVVLTEDYTALKEKGLTDYELDIHATVTAHMKVSRDTGLQMWRHVDMAGGTELSQRYVNRDQTEFRKLVGFEVGNYPEKIKEKALEQGLTEEQAKEKWDDIVETFYDELGSIIGNYSFYRDDLIALGLRQSRSKEVARALLPNATTTKIIQCRPLRQWKHYINLRNTNHAQKEIQEDTVALVKAFEDAGVVL